jgi:MSHA biogenesis protein MshP
VILNQNGVSLIAAIFIIVVLAFMGLMFVSLIGTGSLTSVNDLKSAQALYIAEGGIERTLRFLQEGNNCGAITATFSAATNLGDGNFTVTGTPFRPLPQARLLGAIGANDTTIQSNTADLIVAGYAPAGRITIQDPPAAEEIIEYSSIAGDTFTNCRRGVAPTVNQAHAGNQRIVQNQCDITATGMAGAGALSSAQRKAKVSVWQ